MARYRSRSYSPRRRSRTPPPPRDRKHRDRRSPTPSGLLIRNLPLDARPDDLRVPFERFGPVRDVYLPKNYYTGEPRGFGFVKFRYPEDAAEAKQRMNHKIIGGREISIVFAEENRKTPQEMRTTSRVSGRHGRSYRRTPPRSPRRRYRSYSRSPSPSRHDSRDRSVRDVSCSPRRSRSISRSRSHSPYGERNYRTNQRSPSPRENGQTPWDGRDHAPSKSHSSRGNSRSRSRSHSRSISPR